MLSGIAGKVKRASALVGATALLALGGQAEAAKYVGQWDPAFGAPFTSLGWRGEATFEIPDACLTANGTFTLTNFSPCASGGLKMLSADVDFYNLADPSTVLDTLSFTTPSLVLSMTVSNHSLSSVVGSFLSPEHSDLSIAGGDTDFWLSFIKVSGNNYAQLAFVQYGPCRDDDEECHKQLVQQCIIDAGLSQISSDPNGRPLMTFSLVPEPGTVALLVSALGVLGIARRRRTTS